MIIEPLCYPMTDEQVRRKLLWLLQRLSSYRLWQRKRDAWALFAEQYEAALKTWPEDQCDGFHPKAIIWIYDALRLYDQGLPELAMGNRQVWQRMTGEFHQLARPVGLVRSFFYPRCHERWSQVEAYPPAIQTLNNLRIAEAYRGDNLLYPPHDNVGNFYDAAYLLDPEKYRWEFHIEPYPVFPKNLPPVPERHDIIIKTDDPVPCDGIWEPVKIHYHRKFLVVPTEIRGFTCLGAFNYFIRGMNAPRQAYVDILSRAGFDYRDVHWRLVWQDNRYCDGIIPDESDYFLAENPGKRITRHSGEACPHTGRWATLAGGQQQFAEVKAGALMPKATQYQSDMFAPEIVIPATWSLLHRDDEGNVYLTEQDH
ncbi:Imm72 family immunity protein [Acerihabitans sp. TG2]|uniref:Imm72 family immunity protein n=1 Tax=Acerihabitans sp. TG2 TaxID=3096008 RepID=UPI002B235E5A|nr:Imm72 family immunity protein [Acerihabitans sp. TG2]MEA9390185.1 Imm72 family immunity protein [Acerihabitans sp. TG2]